MSVVPSTKSARLALYRQILRLHRHNLQSDLRFLGDSYVREEFRKHRKAESEFLPHFYKAWFQYAKQLNTGNVAGQELEHSKLKTLTEDQLRQLSMLKRESTRPLKD